MCWSYNIFGQSGIYIEDPLPQCNTWRQTRRMRKNCSRDIWVTEPFLMEGGSVAAGSGSVGFGSVACSAWAGCCVQSVEKACQYSACCVNTARTRLGMSLLIGETCRRVFEAGFVYLRRVQVFLPVAVRGWILRIAEDLF